MSYILDALRKSEQERQVASGRGAGMLFPVLAEHSPKSVLKPLLLAGTVLAVIVIIVWVVPKFSAMGSASNNSAKAEKPVVSVAVPPPLPLPAQAVQLVTPVAPPVTPARPRKPVIAEPVAAAPATPPAEPVAKKASGPAPREVRSEQPSAPATNKTEAGNEAPKGLPPLIISGYINDEQGANMAIINDKLVREGEEVAPGVRLEKIIDESAIFTYKGQRFRR